MKLAAVVCSIGRASLAELLACIDRQTVALPTLLWLDNVPDVHVHEGESVYVVHGGKLPTLGAVRHAAVEAARDVFQLGPRDGFLVLDDDDFYAPTHHELTRAALERSSTGWASSLSIGITRDRGAPEHCVNESGIGQHGTWGLRLDLYDSVGGYPDDPHEDTALAWALGRKLARPGWHTTHVRREHTGNLSGAAVAFDTQRVRELSQLAPMIRARWTAECSFLAAWCASRAATRPR